MRPLNPSEKRTIRYAVIGLAIYLVLFVGVKAWASLHRQRMEYLQMVAEARQLKVEAQTYTARAAVVRKLMDEFNLDPATLSTNTVVAGASAAIQTAATSGGVQPGPIRESAGRASAREMATIQFEGTGQVAAIMALVHRLPLLGYPLVIDSLQITSDPMRPGQIKMNVTIEVLDFEQWKKTEAGHA